MKSSVKKAVKLNINKQTIRTLGAVELAEVAGGRRPSDFQSCGGPFPAPSFCA